MSTNEITGKIKELRELQSLIEEAEKEAEAIKDALKAAMGEREELRAGEYKLTYKTIESVRLDSTAFKNALPEMYSAFAKKIVTRRFCVT